MKYIDKEFLVNYAQEIFINESSQTDDSILDRIEQSVISILKSYLGTRYNVEEIFSEEDPLENEILKDIVAKIVLYRLIKRNTPRNVPTNFKEMHDEAMKSLKELATGVVKLSDLPVAIDDSGAAVSNTMFGNTTNKDYYI